MGRLYIPRKDYVQEQVRFVEGLRQFTASLPPGFQQVLSGIIERAYNDEMANYIAIEKYVNSLKITGGNPRPATLVVAASDSAASSKSNADLVCPGADDQNAINPAILSVLPAAGGEVLFLEGTYNLTDSVTCAKPVRYAGMGESTLFSLSGNPFLALRASSTATFDNFAVTDGCVDGGGFVSGAIGPASIAARVFASRLSYNQTGANSSAVAYSLPGANVVAIDLYANLITGNGQGVDAHSSSFAIVIGCVLLAQVRNGQTNGGLFVENGIFANNELSNFFYGIGIAGGNPLVSGNDITGGDTCIEGGGQLGRIKDNRCIGFTHTGIHTHGSASDNYLEPGAGATSSIRLGTGGGSNATDAVARDNIMRSGAGGHTSTAGVVVEAGSTGCLVVGNDTRTSTATPVSNGGTGTLLNLDGSANNWNV